MLIKILFWVCFFIVFYSYLGYGILLWVLNKLGAGEGANPRKDTGGAVFVPEVALIIAAYNEEDYIEDKIKNTLELSYPKEKLKIYFVTDGSTDKTAAIVASYPLLTLFHQDARAGKAAAMNRAVGLVTAPILVFCDANTMLNKDCIEQIVHHYADARVGAVAGEKKIFQPLDAKAASAGEGLYWKYESFLKQQDSNFYSVVGAAGELFSVRRNLYEPVEKGVIIEDFVLSLNIARKGYLVKYSPGAYAIETASASIKDEQKRKVRICAGAFQAMGMLLDLLNIFKYGKLSFQYISHRVLRWAVTPLGLLLLLPLNILLVTVLHAGYLYNIILALQLFFYFLGCTGWMLANRNIKVKMLYIPYYFLFMNISVFMGFKRYMAGKQSVLWEKAERQKLL
jgi:cellulose synthase/poly-beta-1,6-N-acetylglucosamine synthase-like glycosyltransferase